MKTLLCKEKESLDSFRLEKDRSSTKYQFLHPTRVILRRSARSLLFGKSLPFMDIDCGRHTSKATTIADKAVVGIFTICSSFNFLV
ncbi:hypothetical protein Y032_0539g3145 [Ancylostoma ceylanicum]|uniref:Uncharacterized protein n=1 Tax=Ancylostoma ceylanicum TaxID=53326 RepID=A0A016WQW4_9BILA|nr:hypothetical protein Y032_0539g3145 [Ancylostoma ceylanicum]